MDLLIIIDLCSMEELTTILIIERPRELSTVQIVFPVCLKFWVNKFCPVNLSTR